MAKYDFRILLETVQGNQSSYMTQSFVDTDVELVLSASEAWNRITGSLSCSFQNKINFDGTFSTQEFKSNTILSASLVGDLNTGSIHFKALDEDYDRLLKYKFIGDKVCSVMGLPSNQWIYVDQVRLPTDDEANFFQGNINVGNAFVSDTLTFAGNANLNSDLPIYIDTGSDRYIKFIDTRGTGDASLIFGYDKTNDEYEIIASTGSTFNIKNLNNLEVDTINVASLNQVTSSTLQSLNFDLNNITASGNISASGFLSASKLASAGTGIFGDDVLVDGNLTAKTLTTTNIDSDFSEGSTVFGNTVDDTHIFTGSLLLGTSSIDNVNTTHITASGDISSSGKLEL
jgi:hypothetical protein